MSTTQNNDKQHAISSDFVKNHGTQHLFKYVVTYKDDSIDEFFDDKWCAVVNYLVEDDQVKHLALHDYLTHLDGKFSETDLEKHMELYIEEFAARAGYTIKGVKS